MRIAIDTPARVGTLTALLEGLVAVNYVILSCMRNPPKLYSSGVRYEREQPGRERWLTVDQVIQAGRGDCEDLSAWRAAELRFFYGVPARAGVYRSGNRRFHAVVFYPDGSIEDPSKRLGMRNRRRR